MRIGVAALLLLAAGLAHGANWVVRDVESGAPIAAELRFYAGEDLAERSHAELAALSARPPDRKLSAPASAFPAPAWGEGVLRIEAQGHRPLFAKVASGVGMTFWLDPLAPDWPTALESDALVLFGYVRSGKTLAPIAGARVRIEPFGVEAISDEQGFYRLSTPLPPPPTEPAFLAISLRLPGAPSWRVVERSLPWAPGFAHRLIHDDELALRALHRHLALPEELAAHSTPPALETRAPLGPDDPPASIRVGFNDANCTQSCCGTSCSHVCVFPLETYVRRGITHEWIASWNQHALRAGTVAYRGYGAWRVGTPIHQNYDICSSACCQVNGSTTHSNGIAAVARTRGIIMLRNGARFSAEYSAENNCLLGSSSCSNNDLSCGNGYNGSPANQWPCLADPVGLNQACFGHGRGMSQWGSQRWASHASTPRTWPWIVNHYYNAHGSGSERRTAVMSKVLAIEGVTPSPAAVHPGQSFTISVQARNRAAEPHERVLIGASIRRSGGSWISDPGNDAPVILPSGLSSNQRVFQVPAGAAAGSYDLAVSLFLDIDENQQITSADLLQASLQQPAAITVLPLSTEIFRDGFE